MDHHTHHRSSTTSFKNGRSKENTLWLAFSATFHCLVGCGLGEILGMVIGTGFGMSNLYTMILALILGTALGLLFGMIPLLRARFPFKRALKQVLIAEGLSIAVMESVEVTVQVATPGVMDAHLADWLFWKGMLMGLAAGFIAAFPVNYIFIRKGIRHQH